MRNKLQSYIESTRDGAASVPREMLVRWRAAFREHEKNVATARAEARKAALEEAAKVADAHMAAMEKKLAKLGLSEFDEGLWTSAHTEASYIATAIRALIGTDPATDGQEG